MIQCSTAHIMHHGKCRDTDDYHVYMAVCRSSLTGLPLAGFVAVTPDRALSSDVHHGEPKREQKDPEKHPFSAVHVGSYSSSSDSTPQFAKS